AALQRAIASIGLVQAFCREADELARFSEAAGKSAGAWLRLNDDEVRYSLAVGALFGGGGALILGCGAYLVRAGQLAPGAAHPMTPGALTVFLAYLGMMYEPLCRLTGARAAVQVAIAGARRVFDVLDADPGIADPPSPVPMTVRPRRLRFEHVSFAYGPGPAVLSGVDLEIPPDQMVAFVGRSGA